MAVILLFSWPSIIIGVFLVGPAVAFLPSNNNKIPYRTTTTSSWSPIRSANPLLLLAKVSGVNADTATLNKLIDTAGPKEEEEDNNSASSSSSLRPLPQNWWPLTTVVALSRTKPNTLQVLGKPLVAYYLGDGTKSLKERDPDINNNKWVVMDDRCSHRFAPLSEGRIIVGNDNDGCGSTNHIQCSYHGWAFDAQGSCVEVPQMTATTNTVDTKTATGAGRSVQSYPTRIRAGILWVWTDPESFESLGQHIAIPISQVLQDFCDYYSGKDDDDDDDMYSSSCYMRDLPYGMELLGENLLDVSHLPYAHHGTGALRRENGGALPMQMVTAGDSGSVDNDVQENKNGEQKQQLTSDTAAIDATTELDEPLSPTFSARVVNAGSHDPIFLGYQNYTGSSADASWECTGSFFAPNHIRYRRVRGGRAPSHQELFLCPTAPGKSRVFLFNARASLAPAGKSWARRALGVLQNPKASIRAAVIARMFDPTRVSSHMVYHDIFDGDNVFLYQQGQRMAQANLTFRDYSTPSSSDILLNAYRRYMERVADLTTSLGYPEEYSRSVLGTKSVYSSKDDSRTKLLDRYFSHTENCPVCQRALARWNRRTKIAKFLVTMFQGAAGAMTALAIHRLPSLSLDVARRNWRAALLSPAVSLGLFVWAGIWATLAWKHKCEREAQRFVFVDYVHALR